MNKIYREGENGPRKKSQISILNLFYGSSRSLFSGITIEARAKGKPKGHIFRLSLVLFFRKTLFIFFFIFFFRY